MTTLKSRWSAILTCLPLFLLPFTCEAQIYKWVDDAGRTHYSEKKEDAGKAKAQEVRINSQSETAQPSGQPAQSWQEKEKEFEQHRQQKQIEEASKLHVASAQNRSSKESYRDETDTAKCRLARDILSGSAKHTSGAET